MALGKSWEAKRELAAGVSNPALDEAVEAALAAGATGAKIAGAGGGGFVLVSCPVERQTAVRGRAGRHEGAADQDRPATARG